MEITSSEEVPDLKSKIYTLEPAIGLIGGKLAYVIQFLPTETRKAGKLPTRVFKPWVIFSDHTVVQWNKEKLIRLGLYPGDGLTPFPQRWSSQSIDAFWSRKDEPVDPKAVFDEIVRLEKLYLELPRPEFYDLLGLWIIGSYFQPCFNTYPYLYVGGPKRAGKTKFLEFLRLLAFNAVASMDLTTSALFRKAQGGKITLLVDEAGYLSSKERKEELRTLLYSRYKRGSVVSRTHPKTLKTEDFEVFGPTALANIEGLEDVLEDRTISIIMKRSLNYEILNSYMNPEDPIWQGLRDRLYLLWLQRGASFNEEADKKTEKTKKTIGVQLPILAGRALELWGPIFKLANFVDNTGQIFQEMVSLAKELESERFQSEEAFSWEHIVLNALLKLVRKADFYPIADIMAQILLEDEEEAKFLKSKYLGRIMKRLGFQQARQGKSRKRGYLLTPEKVGEMASRMGLDPNGLFGHFGHNGLPPQSEPGEKQEPEPFDPALWMRKLRLTLSPEESEALKKRIARLHEEEMKK